MTAAEAVINLNKDNGRASKRHRGRRVLLALLWSVASAGCGPARGVLEGSVTCDGVPVTEGYVMLFPTDGNYRNSSSVKIVDGRYRIEGIAPGERRVSLENLKIRPSPDAAASPVAIPPNAYPATITVEAGRCTLDFALARQSSKPGAGK